MPDEKREFTGVWIPRHIIEDESLNMSEMIIYSEIACFTTCYNTNETLGERWSLKSNTVSIIVSKLIKKGYVINGGFNGRRRELKALTDNPNQRQPLKIIKPCISEKSNPAIENNQTIEYIEENTKDDKSSSSENAKKQIPIIEGMQLASDMVDDPDCIREKKEERRIRVEASKKTGRPASWVYDLLTRMKNELGITTIMRGDASSKALKDMRKDIEESEGRQKTDEFKERVWGGYIRLKDSWDEKKYGRLTFVQLRRFWTENDPNNDDIESDRYVELNGKRHKIPKEYKGTKQEYSNLLKLVE